MHLTGIHYYDTLTTANLSGGLEEIPNMIKLIGFLIMLILAALSRASVLWGTPSRVVDTVLLLLLSLEAQCVAPSKISCARLLSER